MKKELTNATIIVRDVLFVLGKLRGEAIEPELFAFVHHFVKDDNVVVLSVVLVSSYYYLVVG